MASRTKKPPATRTTTKRTQPEPTPLDTDLYTVEQAAKLLTISERSLWRRIAERQVRTVRPTPGITRITRRELDRYIEHLEAEAATTRRRRRSA